MLESDFQQLVISEIVEMFPDVVYFKNDPNYLQGNLDWTFLNGSKWAMLEIKASRNSRKRPNQPYYVRLYNEMSYAAFVYPENKDQVLHELQSALRP